MLRKVIPTEGMDIPNPITGKFIPADGLEVDITEKYWVRRIADGSVQVEKPAKSSKSSAAKKGEK